MDRGVVVDEGAVKVMAGSKAGVMRVRPYFWPCLTVPPTPSVTRGTNGWVSQWARNCGRLAGATADLAALAGDDGRGYEQGVGSSRGRFPNTWSLSESHQPVNEVGCGPEWQQRGRDMNQLHGPTAAGHKIPEDTGPGLVFCCPHKSCWQVQSRRCTREASLSRSTSSLSFFSPINL